MASRAKKKRMMPERMALQKAETILSMTKFRMNDAEEKELEARKTMREIERTVMNAGTLDTMERKDAAFRREVQARSAVLELIEKNDALKKRMEEVWNEGRQSGFKEAGWPIIKCCMAGASLMLQEEFSMSDDDIIRGLKTLHEKIAWALNYSEMAEEVLQKTGIELQLDDPLEPVRDIR